MSSSSTSAQEELDAALAAAVGANDVAATKSLLEKGADPDARASVNDTAPIHTAIATHKNPELVGLLAARSEKLNDTDSCDFTPFTHAVRMNLPEIAAVLLDNGANPFPSGKGSEYPLDWAVALGLYPLIGRMLSEGGCPDRPFKRDDSLLLTAARTGDVELARTCLDAGATVDFRDRESGATALHLAAKSGDALLIALLLHHNASAVTQDAANRTPVDCAQSANKDHILTRLLTARHMQETAREMTEGTAQPLTVGLPLRLKKAPAAKGLRP